MKIIHKTIKQLCWVCKGKKCKVCHYTGKWNETINYIIYKLNGKQYAIDSDNIG